jgi:hypothetical protein
MGHPLAGLPLGNTALLSLNPIRLVTLRRRRLAPQMEIASCWPIFLDAGQISGAVKTHSQATEMSAMGPLFQL